MVKKVTKRQKNFKRNVLIVVICVVVFVVGIVGGVYIYKTNKSNNIILTNQYDLQKEKYYNYLNDEIVPEYGIASSYSYVFNDNYEKVLEDNLGVSSIYFEDLNSDGILEMILIYNSIDKYGYNSDFFLKVYTIVNNQVSYVNYDNSFYNTSSITYITDWTNQESFEFFIVDIGEKKYLGIEKLASGTYTSYDMIFFEMVYDEGKETFKLTEDVYISGWFNFDNTIEDMFVSNSSYYGNFEQNIALDQKGRAHIEVVDDDAKSVNSLLNNGLSSYGFNLDWLSTNSVKLYDYLDPITVSSLWDFTGVSLDTIDKRESNCSSIGAIKALNYNDEGYVSEFTYIDNSNILSVISKMNDLK